ncbi:FecR family protein [Pedobacter frigoris]|uniref:FecR family protein n=1 Tax=Pedobacter frigoris TaxID=2571272 RepID=UPI00292E7D3D|nr:FecR domain-containing protein [Pedobacter frigoris]
MENSKTRSERLVDRYLSGEATPEESNEVEMLYIKAVEKKEQPVFSETDGEEMNRIGKESWSQLISGIREHKVKRIVLWPRIAAAVAAAVLVVTGVWFFNSDKILRDTLDDKSMVMNDIAPGKNGATITLANGKVIQLSGAKSGVVIGHEQLAYNDGEILRSALNDTKEDDKGEESGVELTAETTKGQTYIFTLPDGTRVWLNAASRLQISPKFSGSNTRTVKLSGEAYFEVTKDKKRPFIVESRGQQVEVLGTHFNINAYADEAAVRTTLLEGSVKVTSDYEKNGKNAEVTISPGEQAVQTEKGIAVVEKDVEQVIDWKNGDFIFQRESLKQLMSRIARWYDAEVVYDQGVNKTLTFSGQMSRSKDISEILKSLASTGDIKFEVKGSRIRVMNKD